MENCCEVSLLITGATPRIKFITSPKARAPKSSYHVYFAPFTWSVWTAQTAFALISFLIDLTASAVTIQKSVTSMKLVTYKLLIWKCSSLFGQYKHSSIPILFPSQRSNATLKITVAVWLTVTAAILNVYQAAFSSEFALTFPFVTSWRLLTELDNFTFYLLVSNDLCAEFMTKRNGRAITKYAECFDNTLLFPECRFLHKLVFIAEQERIHRHNVKLADLLQRLWEKFHLLCNSEENIHNRSYIEKKSSKGIAFLSYDYEFPHNWNKFSKIMEMNPSLRYGHNLDDDDDFGVTFQGYMFTDGLHSRFSNAVIGRFKYLISSGIYWLWEKWDRIRFSQSGLKTGEGVTSRSKIVSPKALAFDNSGAPWLFGAQIVVWVTAMFVLGIEIVNAKRISVAE